MSSEGKKVIMERTTENQVEQGRSKRSGWSGYIYMHPDYSIFMQFLSIPWYGWAGIHQHSMGGRGPRCTMSSLASTAPSNRRRDYYDGNYRMCSSGWTYVWTCLADSATKELGTWVNRERVLSDDASNSLKLKCGKYAVTDLKSRAVSSHFDDALNLTASSMLKQCAV